MAEFHPHPMLVTDTVSVWDVVCQAKCKHKSSEECAAATHLVFPYRGVYIRHAGRDEAVAEANQVVFFNEGEAYQVSHPVEGATAAFRSASTRRCCRSCREGLSAEDRIDGFQPVPSANRRADPGPYRAPAP